MLRDENVAAELTFFKSIAYQIRLNQISEIDRMQLKSNISPRGIDQFFKILCRMLLIFLTALLPGLANACKSNYPSVVTLTVPQSSITSPSRNAPLITPLSEWATMTLPAAYGRCATSQMRYFYLGNKNSTTGLKLVGYYLDPSDGVNYPVWGYPQLDYPNLTNGLGYIAAGGSSSSNTQPLDFDKPFSLYESKVPGETESIFVKVRLMRYAPIIPTKITLGRINWVSFQVSQMPPDKFDGSIGYTLASVTFTTANQIWTLPSVPAAAATLRLSKINPASLAVGQSADYILMVSNTGDLASGSAIIITDQLPSNLQFNRVEALSGNLTGVSCSGAGQTQTCTLNIPGGLAPGAQALFSLNVTPLAASAGASVINRAYVGPTGSNASAPALYPANCTGTDTPVAGCAASQARTVISQPVLNLSKSNPTSLMVGQPASYGLSLSNSGTLASGTSLTVYDQLPVNVQYTGATVVTDTGTGSSVTPTGVACTASGSVSTGQLLSCSLTLPSGGLPVGSSTAFQINVTPLALAAGQSVSNKAQIDPSGNNAPQTPASCTATGTPAGCAVTTPLTVQAARARLSLSAISIGGVGSFLIRGDNGWVDQTLLTTAPNTPVQGDTQTLSNLNVATTLTETLPAGWALNSVNCVDSNASQSGNPAGTFSATLLGGGQWQLPPTYVKAGANLSCTLTNRFGGFVISGQILIDNGIGQGVAHDGVQNGGEQGQPGITLSLSNCTGTVYASGVSDGAGQFSLGTGNAPAGPVCLQQSLPTGYTLVSTRGGTAGASYNRSNGALTFNLLANTSYSGLLFGNVNTSLLSGEGSQQIQPGQSAIYSHLYTPATSASASLSTTNTASTSGQMWNSVLYRDLNCNGQLDPSDGVIPVTQTLNVLANQQICLLVRVFSPANAPPGTPNRTRLTVMEVLQPVPDISVGTILRYLAVEDQTALSNAGSGLVLFKQVRKVSNCPSSAADQQEFAISNRAAPGDYVEYQLSYSNNSAGPLNHIQIEDAVPAYTLFRSAGCGQEVPAGLQGCSVTQQPAVGGSGALQWTLKDAASGPVAGLQPGGQGSVVFCVQVQR